MAKLIWELTEKGRINSARKRRENAKAALRKGHEEMSLAKVSVIAHCLFDGYVKRREVKYHITTKTAR